MRLAGRVALVTGAQEGIGKAIALGYGREGASVVINYLDEGHVPLHQGRGAEAGAAWPERRGDQSFFSCGMSEEELQAVGRQVPLGRMGAPADVADLAVFLAADESRHITGQTIHVNGGQYLA
jgi:NAD(P)-dependent dehydrogenase (short-subunit alcohol dehydrogenase family)